MTEERKHITVFTRIELTTSVLLLAVGRGYLLEDHSGDDNKALEVLIGTIIFFLEFIFVMTCTDVLICTV